MSSYKIWAAQLVRTVTIYANYYASPTNETTTNYGLYYSLDSGADTLITLGDNISTSCDSAGVINVTPGQTIHVGFKFIGGKLESGRDFDAVYSFDDLSAACPNTLDLTYCGTNNVGGNPISLNISTDNAAISLTIAVVKGSFSQSC